MNTFRQVFEVTLAIVCMTVYSLFLVIILPIYLPILWWEKTPPGKMRHGT
jgi:hypothetical protein